MDEDGLTGRVVVVTGGASGIGRATAQAFDGAGARVFVADLNPPGEGPGEWIRTDVADPASAATLAREVIGRAGPPRALVNAAGWDRIAPFAEMESELIERIVRINLLGAMHVCRAFLPAMLEARGGAIVNVASDAGRVGSSGETAYAGAKGGIIAFTKSLAREAARQGVRANCVCPGPTDTPLFASLPEKLRGALVRAIPFGRLARPEEIAEAIRFFAGDRSGFVTGQVLSVSGGLTMAG